MLGEESLCWEGAADDGHPLVSGAVGTLRACAPTPGTTALSTFCDDDDHDANDVDDYGRREFWVTDFNTIALTNDWPLVDSRMLSPVSVGNITMCETIGELEGVSTEMTKDGRTPGRGGAVGKKETGSNGIRPKADESVDLNDKKTASNGHQMECEDGEDAGKLTVCVVMGGRGLKKEKYR